MYCQVHIDEITTQMVLDKPTEEHEPNPSHVQWKLQIIKGSHLPFIAPKGYHSPKYCQVILEN